MHKIAVISDTHSLLRPEVIEKIKECELILHAGDIASRETMEKIELLGPTYFVRGNADKGSWAEAILVSRELELFGRKIFMIHNRKQIQEDVSDKDIVIYGHSHQYSEEYKENVCYFNPGSCGPKRFRLEITMAILTIDEGTKHFSFEKIDCAPRPVDGGTNHGSAYFDSANPGNTNLSGQDMAKLVSRIMKQMNAGKSATEIAQKNGVTKELVNKVLQIYTTHPGIDVLGILDRLDIWGR